MWQIRMVLAVVLLAGSDFAAALPEAADVPKTAGVPVTADIPEVAVVQKAEGGPKTKERPVCRVERSLGSRVVKSVCKTAAERQKEELDARTNIKMGSGRKGQPTDAFKRPGE